MGYSFRLVARVLLYASSLRQDNTYHGFCYTSRGVVVVVYSLRSKIAIDKTAAVCQQNSVFKGRKEGNVLLNDALNTFYMASDIWLRTILIVRKKTRCRHIGYSYRLTARVFYMHHPTDRITHTTAFVTPVVEHWLER